VTVQRPPNAPQKVWIVQYADGEKHFVTRPLDNDMAQWAAGQKGVTIFEYDFSAVLYHSPPLKGPKP